VGKLAHKGRVQGRGISRQSEYSQEKDANRTAMG